MSPDQSPRFTRRTALSMLGTVGAFAAAGCTAPGARTNETNTSAGSEPKETAPTEPPDDPPADYDDWPDPPCTDCTVDFSTPPAYDDDNWRMLGYDPGNSFVNPHADGPSDDPSVQWTFERNFLSMGASRFHHPLIVDGTVYTTQVIERLNRDQRGHWKFIAIDAATGEAETVFEANSSIWRPTIANGIVYAAIGREVHAYDLETGCVCWKSEEILGAPSAIRRVGDVVVATDSAFRRKLETWEPVPQLHVLHAETGDKLWEAQGDNNGWDIPRMPIIDNEVVNFPNTKRRLDPPTGEELEPLPVRARYPVQTNGAYYGLTDIDDETVLTTYDWETGDHRWTYNPEGENVRAGWPVVIGDTVVVSETKGLVSGVDRTTGERLWRIEPWTHFDGVDSFLGSMFRVATSDTVYIVHDGGAVTAVDPTDGTIEWQLKTDEMNWTATRGGCALAGDLLITVGEGGTLYAIS
ncbi:PQQ-binding-like beta-propeller repeat protein [Halovivax gelatinilyticus]|uniref:outer membrane protein assembly factor BamB family protein n=1 Tax=Halovivax gelatinilyticus TaxID=2961597 RepID=UPI0020CA4FA8|nr:PQQ-binding-like beta-propeller repeat protein [Halovivax gelatinilyticus]